MCLPRPSFTHLGPADISGAPASRLVARQLRENSRVTDGSNSSRSAGLSRLSGSVAPPPDRGRDIPPVRSADSALARSAAC